MVPNQALMLRGIPTKVPTSSDTSCSSLEPQGCAPLPGLSGDSSSAPASPSRMCLQVLGRCHCHTPQTLLAAPSSVSQCIQGMELREHYFPKNITTKPSKYCKNVCSSNACHTSKPRKPPSQPQLDQNICTETEKSDREGMFHLQSPVGISSG